MRPSSFGHEDAGGIGGDVFINVTRFAPAPVVSVQDAQRVLDILFERHAAKRFDGELFDGIQIVRPVGRIVMSFMVKLPVLRAQRTAGASRA